MSVPTEKEIFQNFVTAFADMTALVHQNAVDKGFWDQSRNDGELIALMHSELSEGLEALRKNLASDHIPEFDGIEEELADVIIRIMDMAGGRRYKIGEAICEKIGYNALRPYKHGKIF